MNFPTEGDKDCLAKCQPSTLPIGSHCNSVVRFAFVCCTSFLLFQTPVFAQENTAAAPQGNAQDDATASANPGEVGEAASNDRSNLVSFSFNGAPWREVVNWLADESGLALHVSELPSGSFTYSDPEQFTTEDAISRLNLFLIPQGYSVVRRGRLLSVITLGDPRSMQQLDAMAELVSVDQLSERSANEVVKCMFALGDVDAEQATAELQPLMLMSSPVVLPKSNQLLVVDTVAKLRNVSTVLNSMVDEAEEPTVVKRIRLKYTDFETVVLVAGSHLGLEQGETESANLSLSTDISGNNLFVSGTESQVKKLQSLLEVIDVSDEVETAENKNAVLKSHTVTAGNLQSVYEVLLTILNDRDIRLSMEPKTSSIVALADPAVHQQIEDTIEELKAPAVEFAVVDLQTLDPYFAITLLTEMFGEEEEDSGRDWWRRRDDDNDDDEDKLDPPKIDADPENRRLFIRGTKEQIRQAQQIIASLDGTKRAGEEIRVIPFRGNEASQVLEAATRVWDGRNDLVVLPPAENSSGEIIERAINPDRPQNETSITADSENVEDEVGEVGIEGTEDDAEEIVTGIRSTKSTSPFRDAADLVSLSESFEQAESAALLESRSSAGASEGADFERSNSIARSRSPIRSQLTSEGIVIQSDDLEALDDFEDVLRSLGSSGKPSISAPVAYYLKYVSAEEAVRMLADLLDGENALMTSPSGSLVNGGSISSSGSGYYGSLLFTREGRTTVSAGSATIVSDARLNRLIVQGTTEDVQMVEKYLKLIDKGDSITRIETFGQSHVVELIHSKAEDVAEVIREAYRGRILSEDAGQRQGGQRRDPRDERRDDDRGDDEQNQRIAVEKPTRGRQAEMTLAVHTPSNSLIITAPDQLFAEVEKLIKSVDTKSEQVIQVIPAGAGVDMDAIMERVMGVEMSSSSSSSRDRDRDRSRRSSDRSRR